MTTSQCKPDLSEQIDAHGELDIDHITRLSYIRA